MNIYLPNGFLNAPEIAAHPSWLKAIIGGRQIGKTFNTLKYHLDNNIPFILMRRTTDELDTLTHPKFNPFLKINALTNYNVQVFREGKFYAAYNVDQEGNKEDAPRCMILSLPQLAKRGFDGSSFLSIVFDEFIPEKSVRVLRSEGDDMLNAYTTINSNRELEGKPPTILWLLANSNSLKSPILEAFNLIDDVIIMRVKKKEIIEDGGAIIIQPESKDVLNQRKQTALMQQISKKSEFYGMAIENEFSYDKSPLIRSQSITGYKPLFQYDNILYAWEGSNNVYICRAKHRKNIYYNSAFTRSQLKNDFYWILNAYDSGLVTFSDHRMLLTFQWLFDIDY